MIERIHTHVRVCARACVRVYVYVYVRVSVGVHCVQQKKLTYMHQNAQ